MFSLSQLEMRSVFGKGFWQVAVDGWRSVSGNLEGGGNECFPHQYFHLRAILVLCLLIAPAKTTMLCGMLSTNE